MASFFSFLTHKKIPSHKTLQSVLSGPLTPRSFVVYAIFILLLGTIYLFLITLNAQTLTTVPARGGSLTEGIIGTPQYLNPILASTETDLALTKLTYSGLMKEKADGMTTPELAQSYTVSPDGLSYTFILHPDLVWSDRKPLTSGDVAFTIELLQNSLFNTTTSTEWQNMSMDTPDESTVVINLPTADPDLLSKLTIGIMPEHVWKDLTPEEFVARANTKRPISAGAFTVKRISRSSNNIQKITLRANHSYPLGEPMLRSLKVVAYPNQAELAAAVGTGAVNVTSALTSETLQGESAHDSQIIPVPTNETIALYRTSNEAVLGNASLLTVLEQFIDKNAIAATVEHGYGTQVSRGTTLGIDDALASLKRAGYTVSSGTLLRNGSQVVLSIATENSPRALDSAQALTGQLLSLGITVSVRAFDPGTLQADVLAGNHPIILATSHQRLPDTYRAALTLYTATIPYITTTDTFGTTPDRIASPPLRYANVIDWYTHTDKLWPWINPDYSK